MLLMGLYCFSGSILYRWRSVMSTARSSALWKRLIWEEQITTVLITHPAGAETPISRPAGFCLSVRSETRAFKSLLLTLRTLPENKILMNLSFRCSSLETSVNEEAASGLSRF